MNKKLNLKELEIHSARIRKNIIELAFKSGKSSHIGGSLSMVEILSTLYGSILKYNVDFPESDDRDRFILSKGHGALALYCTLYEFGYLDDNQFYSYMKNGSDFIAHPIMNVCCGIESSNGSLGHGLSMGVGISLAARLKEKDFKTFILMGDGECNEGSVWEAAMAASNYKLNNLTAIIDRNNMQNDGSSDDILKYKSMERMWDSFGWYTFEINGHDTRALFDSLKSDKNGDRPKAIIANTTKGKGISFMENVSMWHHGKLTETLYSDALAELGDKPF